MMGRQSCSTSTLVVMDSGLDASHRPGMTAVVCPTGKAAVSRARRANQQRHPRERCLALVAKIKCFASDPKHLYKPGRPAPPGGAYHERHDTLARDAMDAVGIERRTRPARTAKPCGPGAPMLASSLRVTRRRRWQTQPVTGEQLCFRRPVIGLAQGWRYAPPPPAADGLDPVRSPVF